jgi:hypothetical protein
MASYRDRLTADLDRWIAAGLAPADNREAMLAMVVQPRRTDAASALVIIGAMLVGAAVIALVAANWDGLPRLARFGLLIAAFLGSAGGAALAGAQDRPNAANALLALTAVLYAAAIGLTGQIFDIAGDPKTAALGAGLAAALLALVGRSSGAGIAALVLIGFGDFAAPASGWLLLAGLAAVIAARRWRSVPLAHGAGIAVIVGLAAAQMTILPDHGTDDLQEKALVASALLALATFGARWLRGREESGAGVLYGWWVWGALWAFAAAGLSGEDFRLVHRGLWLLIAGGVIALGRHDRHALVTAAGVAALIGAVAAVMFDLGLDLIYAAAVFGLAALAALVAGWMLRRRSAL